jgi:hypothetical protein
MEAEGIMSSAVQKYNGPRGFHICADTYFAGLEEILGLMEEENIQNTYFVARLCQAAALKHSDYPWTDFARHLAQRAFDNFTICEGVDGESTEAMRNWLSESVSLASSLVPRPS